MKNFIDLFTNKKRVELYNINYHYYENKCDDFDLNCQDQLSIIETSAEKIRVLVTRQIIFTPKTLFSLSVSYFIDHFVKESVIGKFTWDDYNIQDEIIKNSEYFSSMATDRLSLIISEITGSFGNSPLVTPPSLLLKDSTVKR